MIAITDSDRRNNDRRKKTLDSIVLGGRGKNRRRKPRRSSDHCGYYVDWYDSRLFTVVLSIFLLCCTDAWFTLALLRNGADEVNVLMDLLIQQNVYIFVYVKLGMTAIGLLYLVVHSSFRVRGAIRVRHILYLLAGSYVLLFTYQLNMLGVGTVA